MFESYVPLHGHSSYSVGDGVSRIEDLVAKAKELKCGAIGLTEHGNMSSFFKFYKECKDQDVKPVIGCELYVNDLYYEDKERFLELKRDKTQTPDDDDYSAKESDNNHIIVYARNYDGLKSLIHLSNLGFDNFYRKPLVSTEQIFQHLNPKDHIVTTSCLASKFSQLIYSGKIKEVEELIKRYKDHFGASLYFEVLLNGLDKQKQVNQWYMDNHERLGIEPVFALDYHYVNDGEWYGQYLLYCIKQRKTVEMMPEKDWFYTVRDLYIKNVTEVYALADKEGWTEEFLETALQSTKDIAAGVDIDIPLYTNKFPKFDEDPKVSRKIFLQKLKEKYVEKLELGIIPAEKEKEYFDRMKYEFDVIEDKGFIDYFLILDDLLNNFVYKNGGSTGVGRGSAGGSLVLFILDVTKIDPLKHNLIFERFLNPARIDPADVDVDIDSVTHKMVEDYLKEKYGEDKVCHIANFIKFGTKTIVKDLCRVFELDFVMSNKLTSYFDTTKSDMPIKDELNKAFKIAKSQKDKKLQEFILTYGELLIEKGNLLLGAVRQTGKHASGILISNEPLNDSDLPVIRVDGEIITGVQEGGDEREVSELGYCKLDILGLKAAAVINETLKQIEDQHGVERLESDVLSGDFGDQKIYDEFVEGNCRDIFQFGSDSMISLIERSKPENILDLCTVNAIFRPAIIYAGGVDEYVENKKEPLVVESKLKKMSPELWPILKETFGVPAFQEQIMFILQNLGGFTLAEADKGRKILKLLHKGNQEKNKDFNDMLAQFKEGAKAKGMNDVDLEWLLDILGKYSDYSFNKSHSLAYAMNAYMSMYLKLYYSKEYYSSLFNFSQNEELSWFIKDAKSRGTKFAPFKYGKTANKFDVDYDNDCVRYGLNLVKGLSSNDVEAINSLTATDIYELAEQIAAAKISKRSFDPLCRLNYFSDIYENSHLLEKVLADCRHLKKKETLRSKIDKILKDNSDVLNYTEEEYLKWEKKYLQFYISTHPFDKFQDVWLDKEIKQLIRMEGTMSPKEVNNDLEPGSYILYGVVNDIQIKKAKKTGREYYKIILEDDVKQMFITIFNTAAISDIEIGNCILIGADKNNFGFSKSHKMHIINV